MPQADPLRSPMCELPRAAGRMGLIVTIEKSACISKCGRYRHSLGRHWDRSLAYALFIGLNPSTADAEADDPTIRRCIQFSRDWGYGGIEMGNLFDWRSTDPKNLPRQQIAVSDKNDPVLRCRSSEAGIIIAAWGSVPWAQWRIDQVFEEVFSEYKRWYCLKVTKYGFPSHPLYLPKKTAPILFW
jgi:hypothetical protein